LDASESCLEIESFKHQAQTSLPCVESATPLEPCQLIQDYALSGCYPDIEIALHIYLTLPVTVVSCERSFSKLKIIKNYLRSSMAQDRLSNLSIVPIEYDIAKTINFDYVIDEFPSVKARNVTLKVSNCAYKLLMSRISCYASTM
jgi:hypothetical protein